MKHKYHLYIITILKIQTVTRKVALEKDVGQIPVTISTFTNERKLYLSPGVNMRSVAEHPEELTDPVLPYPQKTKLEFKPGT